MNDPTDEDLVAEALSLMDEEPLPTETPDNQAESQPPAMPEDYESPTLSELEAARRPNPKTVCEGCRNSVWFTSPAEVKCYCRVMFLVTWSSQEKNQLLACDGMFLGQD